MKPVLLVDFGSTYTKLTAVDVDEAKILGTSRHYTTVETDINEGFEIALAELSEKLGIDHFEERYACSSAAGGLKMCASGFVPSLTSKAAKMAALGAGAKVIKTYEYELTASDIKEIDALSPDIFLLTGGTNGGNKSCILHNAEMLAQCSSEFPILISGNRSAADQCAEILKDKEIYITENVMPELNTLNLDPVKDKIRDIFLNNIIKAKGLSKTKELIHDILIPTPVAMMEAMKLFSQGTVKNAGLGDLMAVDLGGATTDVYSMADGVPDDEHTILKGFVEPYAKRTVEGDVGMRYSAHALIEQLDLERLVDDHHPFEVDEIIEFVEKIPEDYGQIPDNEQTQAYDHFLAYQAIRVSVDRHVGRLEEAYTMTGRAFIQSGKDLREVSAMIFTGGALVHAKDPLSLLPAVIYEPQHPEILKPKQPKLFVDQKYILSAMGLLSKHYPEVALKIMKEELVDYGYSK